MHSYIHSIGSLVNATRDSIHYTYNSNFVCPADTTQISNRHTESFTFKSISLEREVFYNPSLGTMVFEISEPSMAGHLKKRHDQCFLTIQKNLFK